VSQTAVAVVLGLLLLVPVALRLATKNTKTRNQVFFFVCFVPLFFRAFRG